MHDIYMYFLTGYDGSRLQEAKTRKQIHSVCIYVHSNYSNSRERIRLCYCTPSVPIQALDKLDSKLSHTLRKLQSRFGDVVTYKVYTCTCAYT